MKKLASAGRWVWARVDPRDVSIFGGLGLLSYGLSLVWVPLAFIIPGIVLIYLPFAIAIGATRRRRSEEG